jgi:hypothetical protein|tara:strand:+ start:124 stop:1047 length:924 start_codon:yes stop_codon:yes gene_type:complete
MANEFDIFSVSVKDLDTGDRPQTTSDLYTPKPDQGSDGTYRSLIRFLPNVKNPRKPFVRKYVYWLEDREGNGFYVDSPSTVGDKCSVQDMFFKLRNSESAVDKKMSEGLKRREVFYALVQIVKDPQNRDLEGQVKIMKFGYKIKTKIDEELNPQFDEPTQVFDPFEGKNFELVISKKGGYPNYDSCKFQGSKSAMTINEEAVTSDDAGRTAILDFIKDAPDLSNFDYRPWTDDQRNKVMGVLSQFSNPGSSIETVTRKQAPPSPVKAQAAVETVTATADAVSTKTETQTEDSSKGDDFDDFINGLDL